MDPASSPDGGSALAAPATSLLDGQAPPAAPVTPAAPVAEWAWTDKDGKLSSGWLEKAGYKDDPTLSTIQDVPTLAKAYKETKAMVGRKVAPPAADAKPEEVAAWRKLVGAPEKPEDYGSLLPEGFPKEMWDGEAEKAAVALAHKYHLPQAALKEFAALNANGTKAAYERESAAALATLEQGRAALKTAWGDKFEMNAAAAKTLATALGIAADDDIFTSRPDILQKLAAAAPVMLGADRIVHGSPVGLGGGMQAQADAIRAGLDYQGKNGPQRQAEAQKQLHQLMAAQRGVAA